MRLPFPSPDVKALVFCCKMFSFYLHKISEISYWRKSSISNWPILFFIFEITAIIIQVQALGNLVKMIFFIKSFKTVRDYQFALFFLKKNFTLSVYPLFYEVTLSVSLKKVKKSHMGLFWVVQKLTPPHIMFSDSKVPN